MTLARSLHLPSIALGSVCTLRPYFRARDELSGFLARGIGALPRGTPSRRSGDGRRRREWRAESLGSIAAPATTAAASGKDIRCFRYERHGGGTLHMAQSFTGSCMGLWSVDEGARTFKMNKGKSY